MGVFIAVEETPDARWTDYVPVPPLEGPEGVRYAGLGSATGDPAIGHHQRLQGPGTGGALDRRQYEQEATLRSVPGRAGRGLALGGGGRDGLQRRQAIWKLLRLFTAEPTDQAWQGTGPKYISTLSVGVAGGRPGYCHPDRRVPAGTT